MVDPATATLIFGALSKAAEGAGEGIKSRYAKKTSKLKAKEAKRETFADLLNQALNQGAELPTHRLARRSKQGKRYAQTFQNTADLVRGAANL